MNFKIFLRNCFDILIIFLEIISSIYYNTNRSLYFHTNFTVFKFYILDPLFWFTIGLLLSRYLVQLHTNKKISKIMSIIGGTVYPVYLIITICMLQQFSLPLPICLVIGWLMHHSYVFIIAGIMINQKSKKSK